MLHSRQAEIANMTISGKLKKAKDEAIKLYNQAITFGAYEVAMSSLDVIIKYYQIYSPSKWHTKKYEAKRKECESLQSEEKAIRRFYIRMSQSMDRNRLITDQMIKQSNTMIKKIEKFDKDNRHGAYYYHKYYLVYCIHYSIKMQYKNVYETAMHAFNFFSQQFLSFKLSEFLFLTIAADALLCQRDFTGCRDILRRLDSYDIPETNAKNHFITVRERLNLIEGKEVDFSDISENAADQMKMIELITAYSILRQGRPVNNWAGLFELRNDPTGLGISLNIAKLWSAFLKDEIPDHKDRIYEYQRNNGIDKRSSLMIQYFMSGHLSKMPGKWNPHIEIIPYELIIDHISKCR